MNDVNTRFLKKGDLLERSTEGELRFKKRFKYDEIQKNKHYLIKNQDIIVQVNTDFQKIGCHDVGFTRVELSTMTSEMWLTLLKNVINQGKKYDISIDVDDDEDAEDYFMYDLGVLKQGESTKEDYIARIEEHQEELFEVLHRVSISSRKESYQLNVYSSGATTYNVYGVGTSLEPLEAVLTIGKLCGLFESEEDLEEIKMVEKDIIEHPYSKLYVLMDYLKENKETLPKEVIDALNIGLEDSLTKMGNSYKDSKTYVGNGDVKR